MLYFVFVCNTIFGEVFCKSFATLIHSVNSKSFATLIHSVNKVLQYTWFHETPNFKVKIQERIYVYGGVCISGWIGTVRGVVDILHVLKNQPRSLRTQQILSESWFNRPLPSSGATPCVVYKSYLCDMSSSPVTESPSPSGFRKPLTPSKLRGCSNKLKTASAKLANTQPQDVTTTWKEETSPAPVQRTNRPL